MRMSPRHGVRERCFSLIKSRTKQREFRMLTFKDLLSGLLTATCVHRALCLGRHVNAPRTMECEVEKSWVFDDAAAELANQASILLIKQWMSEWCKPVLVSIVVIVTCYWIHILWCTVFLKNHAEQNISCEAGERLVFLNQGNSWNLLDSGRCPNRSCRHYLLIVILVKESTVELRTALSSCGYVFLEHTFFINYLYYWPA